MFSPANITALILVIVFTTDYAISTPSPSFGLSFAFVSSLRSDGGRHLLGFASIEKQKPSSAALAISGNGE
jgi:hypothetical protein